MEESDSENCSSSCSCECHNKDSITNHCDDDPSDHEEECDHGEHQTTSMMIGHDMMRNDLISFSAVLHHLSSVVWQRSPSTTRDEFIQWLQETERRIQSISDRIANLY
jgi:hypothetical protein